MPLYEACIIQMNIHVKTFAVLLKTTFMVVVVTAPTDQRCTFA